MYTKTPFSNSFFVYKIEKKSIRKKRKKLKSTHQTCDLGHKTEITS